jgi:hypothetical protein
LMSPIGLLVGIVRLRTKATEFMYNYCFFHECSCKVTCSVLELMYAYVTCSVSDGFGSQ